jgi:serine/threonine protein kinase
LIVGRYRLEEQIGAGGMGTVWRATDQELDRVVAMKRAHSVDGDDTGSGRLRYEARIAAGFQHPNIVTVFDVVTEGTDRWLVMEYVPSRSLAAILAERRTLPPTQVAHLGAQIAAALGAVHEKGVVHGDIKPGNVLVTTSGIAKLTDFGVSRTVWGEITLTSTGPVMGTPAYLAPEVMDGRQPTSASDVFSLGATLFAAVEGDPPFGSGENPLVALRRAALGDLEPFRLAGPLQPLLATMLAREPDSRPDAEPVRLQLHEIVTDRPTPPPPSDPISPPRRWLSRRTAVVGAGVLVVAALVVGFLVARPSAQPAAARSATIGDPRGADPCGLMDPSALSRFGSHSVDPAYGNFDRCDVLVQAGGGTVDVEDQFLSSSSPAPLPGTVQRTGSVGVVRGTLDTADAECLRTIVLTDQNRILVQAHVTSDKSTADLCAMAESATTTAVGVLNKSGVPRRKTTPDPHSLSTVDACHLLNASDLAVVPGIDATQADAGFGDWECSWTSNSTNTTVDVRFDRNSPLTAADGTQIQTGSRPAFVMPADDGPGTCAVEIEHRTYTSTNQDQISEIVRITVAGGSQLQSQLCGTATQLANSAAAKLPAA